MPLGRLVLPLWREGGREAAEAGGLGRSEMRVQRAVPAPRRGPDAMENLRRCCWSPALMSLLPQDLSLRVTVAESTSDGRGDNIGHVIIGPAASGMGTTHWNQMLATLRRPVSMWHPVRRN